MFMGPQKREWVLRGVYREMDPGGGGWKTCIGSDTNDRDTGVLEAGQEVSPPKKEEWSASIEPGWASRQSCFIFWRCHMPEPLYKATKLHNWYDSVLGGLCAQGPESFPVTVFPSPLLSLPSPLLLIHPLQCRDL